MKMNFSETTSYHGGLEDGHTILLIEAKEGERTFSDYPSQADCLETIVNLYEEYRHACDQRSSGDLKDFRKWMEDFYRMEMFVYDKSVARYRLNPKERVKQLFEENNGHKTASSVHNKWNQNSARFTNGHGDRDLNSANSIDDIEQPIGEQIRESSDEDEENWDV